MTSRVLILLVAIIAALAPSATAFVNPSAVTTTSRVSPAFVFGGGKKKKEAEDLSFIETRDMTREEMVALCNQQLANVSDLYSQTKQAHWNVKGMHFEALHVLFDKMADCGHAHSDSIRNVTVGLPLFNGKQSNVEAL